MGDGNGVLWYLITNIPLKLHRYFIFTVNKLINSWQMKVKSMYYCNLFISLLCISYPEMVDTLHSKTNACQMTSASK